MTTCAEKFPRVLELAIPGLDPRVRVFRCPGVVDSFAVMTERLSVIVDTLITPTAAGDVMCLLGWERGQPAGKKLLVVNTHGDWDHSFGNGLFDGPNAQYPALIAGHGATSRLFDRNKAEALLSDLEMRPPGWYPDVQFCLPTVEFEDGLTIQGGDLTLELIPTPGHTPDHVCVWIPEIRVLIAGDAAELPVPYIGPGSDLRRLRRSLDVMLELSPETVLYSHGGNIRDASLIAHNIRYLDDAESRCRDALSAPPAEDMSDLTPERLDWPLESVMPEGTMVNDLSSVAFYRDSHRRVVQTTASWLREQVTSHE